MQLVPLHRGPEASAHLRREREGPPREGNSPGGVSLVRRRCGGRGGSLEGNRGQRRRRQRRRGCGEKNKRVGGISEALVFEPGDHEAVGAGEGFLAKNINVQRTRITRIWRVKRTPHTRADIETDTCSFFQYIKKRTHRKRGIA
jgi:hypothetical protein